VTNMLCLLLLMSLVAFAQPLVAPKPTLSVREIRVPSGLALQIDINTLGDLPRDFVQREAGRRENYHLYLVSNPDEPEMRVEDITPDYIGSVDASFPNSVVVQLKMGNHLDSGQSYIVTVSNFDPATIPRLFLRFKAEGTIVTADATKQATEIEVKSPIPLAVQDKSPVQVDRKIIRLAAGPNYVEDTKAIPANVVSAGAGNDVVVKLNQSLSEGREYQLKVTAQASAGVGVGGNLVATGKIKPAGAPVKEDDAVINLTLGGNAAVHQTGVFTLSGKFAPLHPLFLSESTLHWDPNVTADVGLHTTKTSNSIVFDSPFRFVLPLANAGNSGKSNLPTYAAWAHSKPFSIGALEFAIGPRFEVDRNFNRLDAVVEDRVDIRFIKLQRSIGAITALILKDIPKDNADLLEPIRWGLELTPYLGTDEGGYPSQTVTNSKTRASINVAGNTIFRAFGGIRGKIEYLRFSITYDERVYWFGARETVGYATTSGLGVRSVKGWQPHNKVSINYALDPGKHYALAATYEDGRLPPNLEYLDKVTFGLKFLF
jgi:hypothetical protein